jgi:YVTN family beta-propeller protein/autotransporter-associated beta strand protein
MSDAAAVAISPDGRRAYVCSQDTHSVWVIDVATKTLTGAAIGVGVFPWSIAVTPDGSKAFVVNRDSASVSVLNLADNSVMTTIPVGNLPRDVAITPDGQRAYVTNQGSNTLSVINIATNAVTQTLPVASSPTHITITPDGQKAYFTRQTQDKVSVINLANGQETASINVGSQPIDLKVSPDGSTVYVANVTANTGSVIDVQTDSVLDTITGLPVAVGVAFTPDSKYAYITGYSNAAVYVIDTATRTKIATIGVPSAAHLPDIGPNMITGAVPLTIANDADLTAKAFKNYLPFLGGTLNLTGDWTTTRTVSLLSDGIAPFAGTIDTGGFNATINANVINDGTLLKRGAGILTLVGASTQTGGTRVEAGTLAIASSHAGTVYVAAGVGGSGTVSGTGTIGAIAATAGFVSPGTNGGTATGVLHAGRATLAPGVSFVAQINGIAVGTGYDQLDISGGTAALNDATLTLTLQPGYTPTAGATFTIVTHATGTFAGLPEGAVFTAGGLVFRISYHGGSGSDVVLTFDAAPSLTGLIDRSIITNHALAPISFTIGDDVVPAASLGVTVTSSNQSVVPDANLVPGGSGAARTLAATPLPNAAGQTTITVSVSDGVQTTQRSFVLTVNPALAYYLAEGATSSFFSTDILLANPNSVPAPVVITFYKDDGTSVVQNMTLAATSHTTIRVNQIAGMDGAAFSTSVLSPERLPLVVERTMWWDASGYGASTEKASERTSAEWYFAEGSQGFFHTYYLLLNPNATDTIAHVTYLMEDGPIVQRDYPVKAGTRLTIDAGDVPELINRSFGAHITFDQPGLAERAMYFGTSPLFTGGAAATGVTTLAHDWFLAEGATGTFFDTFGAASAGRIRRRRSS